MRTLLWLFIFISSVLKAQSVSLDFEKDLIPEGIAMHLPSKKVYINSLVHNKIVRCNLDGSDPEDFISNNQYGYLAGFGMTIKGDTLYALGNSLPKINNKSILLLLDIPSGKLIKSYPLNIPDFIYLNDIAIGSHGDIYITDSESNNIYTVNKSKDELEVFFSNDEIKHSNGIAISPDDKFLYFASYTSGIRILDIATKKLVNQPNNHKGIDGMKFYNNGLVAIVNSRRDATLNGIYRFHLDKNNTEIVEKEKLQNFPRLSDIPTTFDLHGDTMYFVSDSQLDLLNQETNEIKDIAKLENYQLLISNLAGNDKNDEKSTVMSKRYCTEIGRFDLLFDDDEIAGAYFLKHKNVLGGIWGKLKGNVMTGRWHDADGEGDIIITFTDDFLFFAADYKADDEPNKWYKDTWHGALRPNDNTSFEFNGKTFRCE
ncbi:SMP-30/gluconolactonase/LRE family protein [Flagellimonas pacifica]|uniref:Sugar lactone lactonase YvrE n=1 Tax=Flagellimonas pacifica TaxID=1247520 RepID=A0A285MDA5_9FLAO|nr:SMP-30/gluconolactonase/LRE family protein [Allomuricauda parva]SNY95165.1 Sugar lactone lactonase YvrE [Allomuricauda parva]